MQSAKQVVPAAQFGVRPLKGAIQCCKTAILSEQTIPKELLFIVPKHKGGGMGIKFYMKGVLLFTVLTCIHTYGICQDKNNIPSFQDAAVELYNWRAEKAKQQLMLYSISVLKEEFFVDASSDSPLEYNYQKNLKKLFPNTFSLLGGVNFETGQYSAEVWKNVLLEDFIHFIDNFNNNIKLTRTSPSDIDFKKYCILLNELYYSLKNVGNPFDSIYIVINSSLFSGKNSEVLNFITENGFFKSNSNFSDLLGSSSLTKEEKRFITSLKQYFDFYLKNEKLNINQKEEYLKTLAKFVRYSFGSRGVSENSSLWLILKKVDLLHIHMLSEKYLKAYFDINYLLTFDELKLNLDLDQFEDSYYYILSIVTKIIGLAADLNNVEKEEEIINIVKTHLEPIQSPIRKRVSRDNEFIINFYYGVLYRQENLSYSSDNDGIYSVDTDLSSFILSAPVGVEWKFYTTNNGYSHSLFLSFFDVGMITRQQSNKIIVEENLKYINGGIVREYEAELKYPHLVEIDPWLHYHIGLPNSSFSLVAGFPFDCFARDVVNDKDGVVNHILGMEYNKHRYLIEWDDGYDEKNSMDVSRSCGFAISFSLELPVFFF